MSLEIGTKNPISVILEYSVKMGLGLKFENKVLRNGDFLFKVLKDEIEIGHGQNKKKQKAKFLAAESAINNLKSTVTTENFESKLTQEVTKLKKQGSFKQISANPYIVDFFADNLMLATGKGLSQAIAKESCAEKALERLREISDSENTLDKSCQVDKIHLNDPRIYLQKSLFDQKCFLYFESKFASFEIPSHLEGEIFIITQEIMQISKFCNLELHRLGSNSLNIMRKTKLVLDFGLVIKSCTKTQILELFESLQYSRLCFLEEKAKTLKADGFKLSMPIELVENSPNFYSVLPYFRIFRNDISANIYILDSPSHPSLTHYKWLKSDKSVASKLKTSALLRHWRQKLVIDIPSELLDLLVENFVSEEMPCGLGFRVVCEKISSGVFLSGAIPLEQDLCHDCLMMKWTARSRYIALKEAGRCLIAISQGELEELLDN